MFFCTLIVYLHYRWREIHRCKKAFCFKSRFVNSPKFKTKDRSNQCSFCVYAGGVRSAHCPRIYHGVGILFLHCSFGQGVWRCLQIDGRKATSLTSFLFLYPNKTNRAGTSRASIAHCALRDCNLFSWFSKVLISEVKIAISVQCVNRQKMTKRE